MEILRRAILLMGIASGLILIKFTALSPLITVKTMDFEKLQKNVSGFSEKKQALRKLPLEKFIEEKTKDRIKTVEGTQWQDYFNDVLNAGEGRFPDKKWKQKISPEQLKWQYSSYDIFYKPTEFPFPEIIKTLTENSDEPLYLLLEHQDEKRYLKITWQTYELDDFSFGGDLDGFGTQPPTCLFYPYRSLGFALILFSLLCYIILPARKKDPDAIFYKRSGMIMADFAALLLFVPFFALPLFIAGGSVQAIANGWIVTMVMWPLSFLGAWLLFMIARYASYSIVIRQNGFELHTLNGAAFLGFSEMVSYQKLQLKPPLWLTGLLVLAAIFGKGSRSVLAGGQALMLSGSSYLGLGISKTDGSTVFFWLTNQMGKSAMNKAAGIFEALKRSGIQQKKETRIIKSVLMPDGESQEGRIQRTFMDWLLLIIIIFPFAAIAITSIIYMV